MLLNLKNKQNYGTFIINSFLKLELLDSFELNFETNISPAVLKLGVATLFRVGKYFIRVAKGLLSVQFTLDSL